MPKINVAIVPVTPFEQNCSLVWDETSRRGAVVDPGGDLGRVRTAIDRAGARIEKILLTHGHIDHAGGAAQLAEDLGVPIEGPHEADAYLLHNLVTQGRGYGMVEARNVTPTRWLAEGDHVTVGDIPFAVLHCPGHAPGHVVFVNEALKFAFVGDVLFSGSVGRTDLPGGSHETLIAAIKQKLLPLGDDIAFVCGHGPGSTFGHERAANPFLR